MRFNIPVHGLSVCVDYHDFLRLTYPQNRKVLTTYTVITSSTDLATQAYCRLHGISMHITDVYKAEGSSFNKAKMLNRGLEQLYRDYPNDWILSLDVDTYVEVYRPLTALRPDFMYGAYRKLFPTIEDFKSKTGIIESFVQAQPTSPELPGWGPHAMMGYFQLFHKKNIFYNEACKGADMCDHMFFFDNYRFEPRRQLSESRTFKQSELLCFHLGERDYNWRGRVTPRWDNI